MKKFSLMALIASALIFVGCGNKEGSNTATEAIKAKGGEVVDTVTDSVKKAASDVMEKTTETVKSTASDAVDATKNAVSGAVDATKNAASGAVDTVKDAASATANAATGAVTATANAVTDTAEKATDTATEATAGANGKALYAKCSSCHGMDGKTKALGKSEVIAGQAVADLVTKITEYKAGTRNVATMGALMKGQVASYSDDDIKAVSEYISTLK